MSKLWTYFKSPGAMAILAAVGFGLAIYQGFFYEKKGQLTVSVDALSRVFDVHQPIGGLDISYAGENLRNAKKTLWAMTFSMKNSGNAEIKKGDYDESAPLGFLISGAEIVDQPSVKTGVEYIRENLKIKSEKNRITFSSVIIEPQEVIQVSVLLLGPETTKPTITTVGKIAGLKNIDIALHENVSFEKSFWGMVFEANSLWVHPVRSIVYGFGGLIAFAFLAISIAAIFSPFDKIGERISLSNRQRQILGYLPNQNLEREARFIANAYVEDGEDALLKIMGLIVRMKKRKEVCALLEGNVEQDTANEMAKKLAPFSRNDDSLISKLEGAKLLRFVGVKPEFSDALEDSLNNLINFLKIDLEKSKSSRWGITVTY